MKINEVIRQRRLALGLTQEQVAAALGVSTPAVNKWERAVSYPDITLLPALARLLHTDLNTLLSFQEDLTREEVGDFVNRLATVAAGEGISAAFALARDMLREYPACDLLLLNTALTLDGLANLMPEGLSDREKADQEVEELYRRAAESGDQPVRNQAKAMLFSRCMGRRDYDAAERLLQELPSQPLFDTRRMRAQLYTAREQYDQAAQMTERVLLDKIGSALTDLLSLMEDALREGRGDDLEAIARIARQTVELYGLPGYEKVLVDFQLAMAQRQASACLEALRQLLPSMRQPWQPSRSPLYRHMRDTKRAEPDWLERMLSLILAELSDPDNPECDFLRQDPDSRAALDALLREAGRE